MNLFQKTGTQIKMYSSICPMSTDRVLQIIGKPNSCLDCVRGILN